MARTTNDASRPSTIRSSPARPRLLRSRLLVAAVVLAAGTGVAGCGGEGGETGGAADSIASTPEAESVEGSPLSPGASSEAAREMRRVRQRLSSIQDSAIQDSALRRQMQDVQALIERTMREMHPATGEQMARYDSLRPQLEAARVDGDTARLRSLFSELQELQRSLRRARRDAMQQEEVAAALDSFRRALRARMREVDPATDSLMRRAESLGRQMRPPAGARPGADDTASEGDAGGGSEDIRQEGGENGG